MLIVSAKYLLTMKPGDVPLLDGAIAIENGEIQDVGLEKDLLDRYPNADHENFGNHAILPGLINAHTHLDMTGHKDFPLDPVRSFSENVEFVSWLMATIDYKRKSSPQKQIDSIREGLDACIDSGITCVGDMGSHVGIMQLIEQSGIRAVIFPEVLSYDSSVAQDLYQTAMAIVEKYMDFDSDRIAVGMGPYSPYTLSRNILKIFAQYCRSSNLPIMMHVSESFSEMEFFYNSSGDIATRLFPNIGWGDNLPPAYHKTPIEHLDDIQFLDAKPILVGCVHVTQKDLDRIATKGAKIVWCPRSNNYLKLGRTPIENAIQRNIPVAIATDGISSNNTLSIWDELRFAYELTRAKGVSADKLLHMVTSEAAFVLGMEEIGQLVRGKKADYVVIDLHAYPDTGDLATYLVQTTRNYHIHKVVVGGETIKRMN